MSQPPDLSQPEVPIDEVFLIRQGCVQESPQRRRPQTSFSHSWDRKWFQLNCSSLRNFLLVFKMLKHLTSYLHHSFFEIVLIKSLCPVKVLSNSSSSTVFQRWGTHHKRAPLEVASRAAQEPARDAAWETSVASWNPWPDGFGRPFLEVAVATDFCLDFDSWSWDPLIPNCETYDLWNIFKTM